MSDTPRTDAAVYDTYDDCERGGGEAVSPDFARQLECELAKAREEIERLDKGWEEATQVSNSFYKRLNYAEAKLEAMRPVVEAAKMCDQSCCLDPDDLYLLRKRVAEYAASKKE